ncbi:MAG TPA: type II toxin-antitoxin system VapC family toxin [Dehalococcoidia bacterium]|jgi:predicted nucleic acid-binding protein|nr:type II toxin-antitoxin system VapC family toxin [Dehalococcoidia bacterium]
MPYLVDTDWLIDYLEGSPPAVRLLERLADSGLAISIVTYMEAYQGVFRSADRENAARRFDALLRGIRLVSITTAVARRCAVIREELRSNGGRVRQRALDLLIAASAIEYNLTLVTRNKKDYEDIPNLQTITGT